MANLDKKNCFELHSLLFRSLKRKSEDGGESFSKKSKVNIDDSDFDED